MTSAPEAVDDPPLEDLFAKYGFAHLLDTDPFTLYGTTADELMKPRHELDGTIAEPTVPRAKAQADEAQSIDLRLYGGFYKVTKPASQQGAQLIVHPSLGSINYRNHDWLPRQSYDPDSKRVTVTWPTDGDRTYSVYFELVYNAERDDVGMHCLGTVKTGSGAPELFEAYSKDFVQSGSKVRLLQQQFGGSASDTMSLITASLGVAGAGFSLVTAFLAIRRCRTNRRRRLQIANLEGQHNLELEKLQKERQKLEDDKNQNEQDGKENEKRREELDQKMKKLEEERTKFEEEKKRVEEGTRTMLEKAKEKYDRLIERTNRLLTEMTNTALATTHRNVPQELGHDLAQVAKENARRDLDENTSDKVFLEIGDDAKKSSELQDKVADAATQAVNDAAPNAFGKVLNPIINEVTNKFPLKSIYSPIALTRWNSDFIRRQSQEYLFNLSSPGPNGEPSASDSIAKVIIQDRRLKIAQNIKKSRDQNLQEELARQEKLQGQEKVIEGELAKAKQEREAAQDPAKIEEVRKKVQEVERKLSETKSEIQASLKRSVEAEQEHQKAKEAEKDAASRVEEAEKGIKEAFEGRHSRGV